MAYPDVPELDPYRPCAVPNLASGGNYDQNLQAIEDYLNSLGTYVDAQDADLQEQIDGLDERLTSAETTIEQHGVRLDTLEEKTDDLDWRVTVAESDIDSLEARADTAESDIDALEGRVDTAESDIAQAKEDITELQNEQSALETRVTQAESDIDAVEGRMDTAESDIDALEVSLDSKLDKPATEGTAGQVLSWNGSETEWVNATANLEVPNRLDLSHTIAPAIITIEQNGISINTNIAVPYTGEQFGEKTLTLSEPDNSQVYVYYDMPNNTDHQIFDVDAIKYITVLEQSTNYGIHMFFIIPDYNDIYEPANYPINGVVRLGQFIITVE